MKSYDCSIGWVVQVLYKHKLILFGGFYDTLREVRWYFPCPAVHFWFFLLLWFVSWLIYQKESTHFLFLMFSTSACNTMSAGISMIFMCLTLMIIRYLPPVLTCPRILSMWWQEEVLLKHANKNNDSFLSLPFLQWQEIKPKQGASWPSARSAFQFASLLDEVCSHAIYLLQSALLRLQ